MRPGELSQPSSFIYRITGVVLASGDTVRFVSDPEPELRSDSIHAVSTSGNHRIPVEEISRTLIDWREQEGASSDTVLGFASLGVGIMFLIAMLQGLLGTGREP